MRFKALVFVVLLVVPVVSYAQRAKPTYVGYKYKGVVPSTRLPNGVKHLGGGLLGDFDAETVYGISQVERGQTKMLWLESSTGKDSTGITGWKVLDVLSFPGLTKADHMFFYGDPAILCTRQGNEIPNLVGVGRIARKQGVFKPAKLWVANLTAGKFKPLALTGIKCIYSEP